MKKAKYTRCKKCKCQISWGGMKEHKKECTPEWQEQMRKTREAMNRALGVVNKIVGDCL